jgi:hypothetical protein
LQGKLKVFEVDLAEKTRQKDINMTQVKQEDSNVKKKTKEVAAKQKIL